LRIKQAEKPRAACHSCRQFGKGPAGTAQLNGVLGVQNILLAS
jgi:hypothetical protein